MAGTQLDEQVGIKKETTFGTGVTPDHFPEFKSESLEWIPEYKMGEGLRTGKTAQRSDRRVLVKQSVGGDVELELQTKGLGIWFESILGSATSTLVSGSTYQQLFVPVTTDYLPSYTIQKGITQLGGSSSPLTFTGMVGSSFELSASNADVPTCKFSYVGKAVATATGLATASYASSVELFSFTQGTITVGGSVTVPTTTALASGGTATANIRDFSFTYENGLDSNGFNFGGGGSRSRKPARGALVGTGSITVEYDSDTLRDAWIANTSLSIVLTFTTTATPISGALYPTFQVTLPDVRIEGELPKSNGGDVVTQTVPFSFYDNGSATYPIYVAIRTAETAV
jgi:Phage tail tube protein